MPEPKLSRDDLNDEEKFKALQKIIVAHCAAQIAQLETLSQSLSDKADKQALQACIAAYTNAKADIEKRKYSASTILSGLKNVGFGGVFVGVAAAAFGGPLLMAAGAAAIVGGGTAAGVAYTVKNLSSQCTEGSLMKPVVKAEEKALAFFKKLENSPNLTDENKTKVKTAKAQFKTESANFKKRVALFIIGGAFLLASAAILLASHGVLTPVAMKVAMLGAQHVSAGMATTAVVTKAITGAAFVGSAASMQGKRIPSLQQSDDSSSEQTSLLPSQKK